MAQMMAGRYTAEVGPQGAVVFLIGMRFNRVGAGQGTCVERAPRGLLWW
jgi:hypothetical protein